MATGISCPFNGNPGSRPRTRGGQRGGGGGRTGSSLRPQTILPAASRQAGLLQGAPTPCPAGQCPDHTPSAGGVMEAGPALVRACVWTGLPGFLCTARPDPGWTWSLPQTTCPVDHTPPRRCVLAPTPRPWAAGIQIPAREEALGHSSHGGRTRLPCGPLGTGLVEPTATSVLQQCHVHTSPQHAS